MNFILLVTAYNKDKGFNDDNVQEITSFNVESIEECVKFIKWHKKHTRNVDSLIYGYEIIDYNEEV